jgi:small subunit ribosomal protein S1
VTKLTNFGAFVELERDLEGLLHISELADHKIDKPQDVVKLGQEIEVKILRVDTESRKIGLSLRRVQWAAEEQEQAPEPAQRPAAIGVQTVLSNMDVDQSGQAQEDEAGKDEQIVPEATQQETEDEATQQEAEDSEEDKKQRGAEAPQAAADDAEQPQETETKEPEQDRAEQAQQTTEPQGRDADDSSEQDKADN